MRICYFGDYQLTGRTKVLRAAIQESGHTIVDCHSDRSGLFFYVDLWKKLRRLNGAYDLIFIGNSGPSNFLPIFSQIITRKPIVWEPLFSIYDNYVFDRKVAPKFSLKALYYYVMDSVGAYAADVIVLDTNAGCDYFMKTFYANPAKMCRVLIGADMDVFQEMSVQKDQNIFEIEYHGKYIPVQGTDVIIRAAKNLEDDKQIHFTMIGNGQMYKETVNLAKAIELKNVTFLPFMPVEELRPYIARADVCFGLVGDVPRVVRAIPNKLYEAAAMGKVTINADTEALREVFTPGLDVVGVPAGDVEAIVQCIRTLKSSGKASELGMAAKRTFLHEASYGRLSDELKVVFQKALT